jgi:hypothetical protein
LIERARKLVDDLLHPYFTDYPALIIADSLLHAIIEQDPKTSMSKSIKYNLPKLLEKLTKKRESPCQPIALRERTFIPCLIP